MAFVTVKSGKDFKNLCSREALKISSDFCSVFLSVGRELDSPCQLGMTVSRKVGKAVVRNKVKRRLRHIFRIFTQNQPHHFPLRVVIIAKKAIVSASFQEISQILLSYFTDSRITQRTRHFSSYRS